MVSTPVPKPPSRPLHHPGPPPSIRLDTALRARHLAKCTEADLACRATRAVLARRKREAAAAVTYIYIYSYLFIYIFIYLFVYLFMFVFTYLLIDLKRKTSKGRVRRADQKTTGRPEDGTISGSPTNPIQLPKVNIFLSPGTRLPGYALGSACWVLGSLKRLKGSGLNQIEKAMITATKAVDSLWLSSKAKKHE